MWRQGRQRRKKKGCEPTKQVYRRDEPDCCDVPSRKEKRPKKRRNGRFESVGGSQGMPESAKSDWEHFWARYVQLIIKNV